MKHKKVISAVFALTICFGAAALANGSEHGTNVSMTVSAADTKPYGGYVKSSGYEQIDEGKSCGFCYIVKQKVVITVVYDDPYQETSHEVEERDEPYAIITGYEGDMTNISIPAEIDGYNVNQVERGEAGFPDNLERVVIGEGILSVTDNAFAGCTNLEEVNFPDTLLYIGKNAFKDCTSLINVELGPKMGTLGEAAFENCTLLEYVDMSACTKLKTIETAAFNNCPALETVILPDSVTYIKGGTSYNGAFAHCTSLKNITLPSKLERIGDSVFYECTSLERIDLPRGLFSIGLSAFEKCTSLRSIEIPIPVSAITYQCFAGCTSLETVILPESLEIIYNYAFKDCTALKHADLPHNLVSIGFMSFANTAIERIDIPGSVTTLESRAFLNCRELQTIAFSGNIGSFGDNVFDGCSSLTDIALPQDMTVIPIGMFANCTGLKNIVIPERVTRINSSVFQGCTSLEHIELPSRLQVISAGLFEDCSSLETIDLPESVTTISIAAFKGCSSLKEIEFGENLTSIGTYYDDYDAEMGAFARCTSLKSVTIPANVSVIGAGAFAYCDSIEEVTIRSTNANIGDYAFYCCESLKNVDLGSGIGEIGTRAFYGCHSLYDVVVPESVYRIGYAAFASYGLRGLHIMNPDCNAYVPMTLYETVIYAYSDSDVIKNAKLEGLPYCLIDAENPIKIYYCYGEDAYDVGETVEIRLTATGDELTYEWFVKDPGQEEFVPIDNNSEYPDELKYVASEENKGRVIYCLIRDKRGDILATHEMTPYIVTPVRFIEQPVSVTVKEGKDVDFSAFAEGDGRFDYFWQYSDDGGETWNSCGDDSLYATVFTVTAGSDMDGYMFRCVAFREYDNDEYEIIAVSDAAVLMIEAEQFYIDWQPQDEYVSSDGYLTFSISAVGKNVTYQWQYSSDNGLTWQDCTKGVSDQSYYHTRVEVEMDGYMYRCVVRSGEKTLISDPATLTLEYYINILSDPEDATVREGDEAYFDVGVWAPGVEYQWQYSSNGGKTWNNCTMGDPDTDHLTVQAELKRNGYMYRCVLTAGDVQKVTEAATLTVERWITLIFQPDEELYVTEGETFYMGVYVLGSEREYQWQYSMDKGNTWNNCTKGDPNTETLSVEAAAFRNGYMYRCVVTSGDNEIITEPTTIVIGKRPQLISQTGDVTAYEGTTATFRVNVEGKNITYRWMYSMDNGNTWKNCTKGNATTATLSVDAVAYRNGYMYKCDCDSPFGGLESAPVVLTVASGLNIDSQPANVTVTEGKTAKFTVGATGSNVSYQWQYSMDGGKTWSNCTKGNATTAALSVDAVAYRSGYMYRAHLKTPSKQEHKRHGTKKAIFIPKRSKYRLK